MKHLLTGTAALLLATVIWTGRGANAAPTEAPEKAQEESTTTEGSVQGPSRAELEARLARAELLAGLTPVEGPGLIVTLRHSPRKPPRGLDRSNLLLHDRDVNAVIGALRAGGAEALAIIGAGSDSGERITAGSIVAGSGKGALSINGAELKPPVRLLAVGNTAALRAELARKDGAVRGSGLDVLQMVEIADSALIRLPAARHLGELRFARVANGPPPVAVAVRPVRQPEVAQNAAGAGSSGPGRSVRAEGTGSARLPGTVENTSSPTLVKGTGKSPEPDKMPATASIPAEGTPGTPPSAARVGEGGAGKNNGGELVVQPGASQPRKEPVAVAVAPRPRMPGAPAGAKGDTQPPVAAVSGPVFGGKGLAKYHVSGCRFGERISRLDRETFVSPEEAKSRGRTPCSVCCSR